MEKDNLKDFIQKNKSQFEDEFNPAKGWDDLEQKLPSSKKRSGFDWLKIAAAVLVLCSVGVWLMYQQNNKSNMMPEQVVCSPENALKVSPELLEAEYYYQTVVNEKMKQVQQLTDDKTVLADVEHLNKEYNELKQEMCEWLDDEKVMEAIKKNYQLRIEIMDNIIKELKA
jgi:molybdopterin converting factor small subunit